jgi:hypothetical protein
MKSITRFYDLHQYGIRPLTGEADLFGQRMLCDLTPQGAKLVAAWLGLSNAGLPCNPAWNAGGAYGRGARDIAAFRIASAQVSR